MLASVFNSKRKTAKVHKKFSTITSLRRTQSPPSPASFASPEIVEINEKGPVDSEDHGPSTSVDHSISSPQIQLDLDTDSLSDWLPPSIAPTSEKRTPPRRNVSLPYKAKALPDAPSTSRTYGGPEAPIIEETELREPNRPFLDASIHGSLELNEASAFSSTRKPTPSPIKIPSYFTSSNIKVQRSAEEANDANSGGAPPPLPTKSSRPSSPSSTVTDDMSSAVSGTSLARALVVNSFILSSESRRSGYKSGIGRQDSATLPRGEHPLINSPYTRERRASSGSPGSARSSSVPPVPRLPSRAELGLSMDSTSLHRRNSVGMVLDSADEETFVPASQLRRPKSTGRLRREQSLTMPPISPISEAPSPAPSTSDAPILVGQVANASSRSLVNSVAARRSLEGSASSSSLATADSTGGHWRAATEPASMGRPGTGNSTTSKESARKGGSLAPNAAMPGTMRSSGAFALNNGRLAFSRTISETGTPRAGQSTRPSVLLPIGERPTSVLIPASPQPPNANPTPTSSLFGPSHPATETPADSPDLLDSFPLQIAPQRATGPPPPLPLGRRSEDSSTTTPQYSSSGESMPSATDHRQTFPETPNAFSPLWTSSFQSPPSSSSRMSTDRSSTRGRGVLEIMRMARGMSGSVYSKPSTARSSRIPLTPPLSGESGSSQPGSPMAASHADPTASPVAKRLTAIEEQVASRAISTYSTVPEPPTSAAPHNTTFSEEQKAAGAASSGRGRGRSGSNAMHARGRSISGQDQSQELDANQAQMNVATTAGSTNTSTSNISAAEQAKAAEASSDHRRLRSVTNPDEPLVSPPPSYAPSFSPPPHTPPAASRSDTGDSASHRSSSISSGHLQAGSSSPSSIPLKRSLSPFPSPPSSSSAPSSPSPGPSRSRVDAHASSISVENPPPPYVENLRSGTPPAAAPRMLTSIPSPPILGPAPPARLSTPDIQNTPRSGLGTLTPDGTPSKRTARVRPPLPAGPRKPSYSAAAARMRAGSVSSLGTAGPSSSNPRVISMMSHAAPKFQTSRVPFRGLTMEAAQWTLTSQQLQHVVSTAIRQSADASAIRILPTDVLESELPQEIERLEGLSAELKLKYKLNVRKRNTLLANVNRVAESVESGEHGAAATLGRMTDELSDVTEILDQTSEELYTVTDQLAQLVHLRDVHQRSALAMALRKLNSSFLKQVGEVQRLREQVAMLEAERDEAWREAQEVAQEFDDYTDRIMTDLLPTAGNSKDKDKDRDRDKDSLPPSRRSSRVMVARKNSQRASKAGLRSMYRRSQRSSTSSNHRFSGVASPGVWAGPGAGEDIPPVPPIPLRHDLAFPLTGDLPTSAMDSPSSDLRAMVQAQKELCEMLGISVEELKNHHSGPSRRQSMSALPGMRSPVSAGPTRRNSDVVTPNHQKTFKTMSKEI